MKKGSWILTGYLMLTVMVWAEQADTLTHKQIYLEDIVVQSFKQDKELAELPVAATVVNGTMLKNRNMTSIKDLSAVVPNLYIPDFGSKMTSPVYIRGIGSRLNAPSVGLYVDGIPYFEKSAFDFDFNEIDHVEVLRGPQGTLYGRNTMGGLINVYTKSPLKYQQTNLFFSTASYTNIQAAASHYGKISENIAYSVSTDYHHLDGYFTNLYTSKAADVLDEGSGRIRLDWQINPALTLKLLSSIDYIDQGGYPYAVMDITANKVGEVEYDEYSFYRRTLSTNGAILEYEGDRYILSNQTSFQYISDRQKLDQDFTAEHLYLADQKQKQNMFSDEFNIKSKTDNRYKWLFGAFGFWQKLDYAIDVDRFDMNMHQNINYNIPTYGIAFYHQSTIDRLFTEGLSLSAGVRYDYEHASIDNTTRVSMGENVMEPTLFDSNLSFNQVTPRFSLQYTFPSSQMIYGTVTRGYKTGGFNTATKVEEEYQTYKPEYSWNYEFGAKTNFWENRIRAEMALFYIDWKNQQTYQRIDGIGQILRNAARSTSKGVEVTLLGNLFNGFMLQANYGYTHAKFKDYYYGKEAGTQENIDYSGNYIPFIPDHTFSIGADYTLSSLREYLDRITFSVNYTGTGKLYWSDSNVAESSYYGVLNAKVSATKGILTMGIWARNLTNSEYTTYAFTVENSWFGQKGKPFTIGTNVAVSF
ncbi:MAG: TonB-dependent receptor [Tannerellaceae bacterium]|nr:TonB-dependent receptor [Tannerellaceae bacterium]